MTWRLDMGKKIWALAISLLCLVIAGCGNEEEVTGDGYSVYYLSNSETRIEVHRQDAVEGELEDKVAAMAAYLSETPEKFEYKAPFAMVKLLGTRVSDGRLTLDVDEAYRNLPATTEVLVRAAIVRSFTQLDGVNYVVITVNGEQLYDNTGRPIGIMSADQFINNDGNEINTYELTKVRLYFANEKGNQLIAAYREKHYSTNTPLERFVVEELIAGPSGQIPGLYPTISPDTKVISVSTRDGICYVNLDSTFLSTVGTVSTEVKIYSIVNTLVELSNVNKVQILVNGEVPSSFPTTVFERNLDYVTVLEP